MLNGRFEQRNQVEFVPREPAGNEGAAKINGRQNRINRRLDVGLTTLTSSAADIRGGRKLSFSQSVNTVVLQHIQHVYVAPDGMTELAEPDGK